MSNEKKKFAASYSGGKESAWAVYKAIGQGHSPLALITTYNTDAGRSHFHGLSGEVLDNVSDALDIPLWLVKIGSGDYAENFDKALRRAKSLGASSCVFGDVDIEGHRQWCTERCDAAGIEAMFPLWGMARDEVVYELIDSGFTANITVIDTRHLTDDFLGQKLTKELALKIARQGADICGENGEYHTFVSDGPIFKKSVCFSFGEKVISGDYAMLPVKP
jgi:uncharacterized protein (TIGR00290 family)